MTRELKDPFGNFGFMGFVTFIFIFGVVLGTLDRASCVFRFLCFGPDHLSPFRPNPNPKSPFITLPIWSWTCICKIQEKSHLNKTPWFKHDSCLDFPIFSQKNALSSVMECMCLIPHILGLVHFDDLGKLLACTIEYLVRLLKGWDWSHLKQILFRLNSSNSWRLAVNCQEPAVTKAEPDLL